MKLPAITLIVTAALLIGCTEKRSYTVSVKNETARPLTVGLVTSEASFDDANWASPEDVAILHAHSDDQTWGVTVAPGKTGRAGPIDARFSSDGSAWLRIYAGELTVSELLAISKGSPNRLDLRLHDGDNRFVITGERALTAERVRPTTAPVALK